MSLGTHTCSAHSVSLSLRMRRRVAGHVLPPGAAIVSMVIDTKGPAYSGGPGRQRAANLHIIRQWALPGRPIEPIKPILSLANIGLAHGCSGGFLSLSPATQRVGAFDWGRGPRPVLFSPRVGHGYHIVRKTGHGVN